MLQRYIIDHCSKVRYNGIYRSEDKFPVMIYMYCSEAIVHDELHVVLNVMNTIKQ